MNDVKVWFILSVMLLSLGISNTGTATDQISYVNSPPITISSDSDFAMYGFPGSGTQNDPYIIEGYNITGSGAYGIMIGDGVSAYFVIRNCFISGYDYGIAMTFISSPIAIVEDTVINAGTMGISISNALMVYLLRNFIQGSVYGISVSAAEHGTAIVNNTIKEVNFGISLAIMTNGLILNNTINAIQVGIGMDIEITDTQVCWNTIREVSETGIGVDGTSSKNLMIHHNAIYAGLDFGDYGITSLGVQYYQNSEIYWYDNQTTEGNYWSNWSGTGTYVIVNPDNNQINEDLYPLSNPPVPTNNFPDLPTYTSTDTGNTSTDTTGSSETEDTGIEYNNITNPLPTNLILVIMALLTLTSIIKLFTKRHY